MRTTMQSYTQRLTYLVKHNRNFPSPPSSLYFLVSLLLICGYLSFADFSLPRELSRYSDSLRAGWFGDRIPMKATFSAPILLYSGYLFYFPGVKRPGRGVNHLSPYSAEVKERVEVHVYSASRPSWPLLGANFTFSFRSFFNILLRWILFSI
jgi:hypothetical protein